MSDITGINSKLVLVGTGLLLFFCISAFELYKVVFVDNIHLDEQPKMILSGLLIAAILFSAFAALLIIKGLRGRNNRRMN